MGALGDVLSAAVGQTVSPGDGLPDWTSTAVESRPPLYRLEGRCGGFSVRLRAEWDGTGDAVRLQELELFVADDGLAAVEGELAALGGALLRVGRFDIILAALGDVGRLSRERSAVLRRLRDEFPGCVTLSEDQGRATIAAVSGGVAVDFSWRIWADPETASVHDVLSGMGRPAHVLADVAAEFENLSSLLGKWDALCLVASTLSSP